MEVEVQPGNARGGANVYRTACGAQSNHHMANVSKENMSDCRRGALTKKRNLHIHQFARGRRIVFAGQIVWGG